jgi:Holliday junction resolvase
MSGTASQRKGRRAELELVSVLKGYGCESVQPGEAVSYGTVPDIVGLPGAHIECKRCEQLRLAEWTEQAERDALRFRDGLPAVFHRKSWEPWRVTMRLSDFMQIYQRARMEEYDGKS